MELGIRLSFVKTYEFPAPGGGGLSPPNPPNPPNPPSVRQWSPFTIMHSSINLVYNGGFVGVRRSEH
jgi:hypothetical protein